MNTIILHGWGHKRVMWDKVTDKLGKNAEAWDLPGFGDEKLIDPEWNIPEYADWVDKKIKKKGYKKVVLVGHSFGGRVASYLASSNPKYLKGLILIGSPSIYRPTLKIQAKNKVFGDISKYAPYTFKQLFYTKERKKALERGLENIFKKTIKFDQTDNLKKIKAKTFLIWGENDKIIPLFIGKEIHRLIPDSKMYVIPDSAHNPHLDSPDL